jgi:hypothetical protein
VRELGLVPSSVREALREQCRWFISNGFLRPKARL